MTLAELPSPASRPLSCSAAGLRGAAGSSLPLACAIRSCRTRCKRLLVHPHALLKVAVHIEDEVNDSRTLADEDG